MTRKPTTFARLGTQNGIVFVTVLMIIITMMIVTVTVVSLNLGQVITTEGEIQRMQAQELATGLIYYTHGTTQVTNPLPANPLAIAHAAENMDGQIFTPTVNVGASGTGLDGTRLVTIRIAY